ncbi:Uracil-DNA glycosylase [Frankliniella fusca]|uniref:Uracil-DNA glycosylase n=1 Tax=Frankliniella fusca TaxID=407009 RepID=A0AAE1I2E6_9NEOP|nr:Uracil-DNA glycosylase [Frankliniella fusca]
MSSQKNLMSFFKPVPKKRSLTADACNEECNETNGKKKLKLETDTTDDCSRPDTNSFKEGIEEPKPKLEETDEDTVKSTDESQENTCDNISEDKYKEQEEKISKENNQNSINTVMSTPPNKNTQDKTIMSPFGMLTPLQCLARIKSQVAKTPALHPSIGSSWFFALQTEFKKPYFAKLSEFVTRERQRGTVYPPADQVWTWTTKVPIRDIKVVILGQDPYHNPGQAHGLCFSVPKGVPPPPSLLNMYKELATDIPGFTAPKHGYLEGWAEQGVLLLNACLTVRANSPNSHKDQGWEQLTDAVIKYISEKNRNVVFLLWGSYAQKKGMVVDKKKHHILKTVHPSPLSAHRGFLGCKHFSQCNELLHKAGKKPIDWSHLP